MQIPTLPLSNGDRIPALGLGTWKAEPGEVATAVTHAILAGYRHIDCAPIYGNEPEIGGALKQTFAEKVIDRSDLWVTSKLWNDKHLKKDVRPALEKTLADLQLDYLDLYLIHWPIALSPGTQFPKSGDDYLTPEDAPLGETWEAMEELLDAGLCRHIGVSNFSPSRMRETCDHARLPPEVNQVECHPLLAQRELLDACREKNVILTAYSPLGTPGHNQDGPSLLELDEIREIASAHDTDPAQIILAWALQRGTTAIPKAVSPKHQRSNLEAARLVLEAAEMEQIDALDRGHRFINGGIWAAEGSPYTLDWLWRG